MLSEPTLENNKEFFVNRIQSVIASFDSLHEDAHDILDDGVSPLIVHAVASDIFGFCIDWLESFVERKTLCTDFSSQYSKLKTLVERIVPPENQLDIEEDNSSESDCSDYQDAIDNDGTLELIPSNKRKFANTSISEEGGIIPVEKGRTSIKQSRSVLKLGVNEIPSRARLNYHKQKFFNTFAPGDLRLQSYILKRCVEEIDEELIVEVNFYKESDNSKTDALKTLLIDTLKNSLNELKAGSNASKDKCIRLRKIVLASVLGEQLKEKDLVRAVSRLLDVQHRNVTEAIENNSKLLSGEELHSKRQIVSRQFDSEHQILVVAFWLDNTRVSPCKKDVVKFKDANGNKVSKPRHFKEMAEDHYLSMFKLKNPNVDISLTKFRELKPPEVRCMRCKDYITCSCLYHEDIRLVLIAIWKARKFVHRNHKCKKGSPCQDHILPDKTVVLKKLPTNAHDFYHESLCAFPEGGEAKIECLLGTCKKCLSGQLSLKFCDWEKKKCGLLVPWSSYETKPTGHMQKDGKTPQTAVQLWPRKTVMSELCHKLRCLLIGHEPGEFSRCTCLETDGSNCPHMKTFAMHCFMKHHQSNQHKLQKKNLKWGHCQITMDFIENYTCNHPREVASEYYVYQQVTIHVCLLVRHAELHHDGVESTVEDPVFVEDQIFVISEDLTHDAAFVSKFRDMLIKDYFIANELFLTELHEWTDGAGSQYKCVQAFADLVACIGRYPGLKIFKYYFETSHAKGPQDGAGGVLKHAIWYYCFWYHWSNMWYNTILTAQIVFSFCVQVMTLSRSLARHGVQKTRTKMWERTFFWIGLSGPSAVDRPATRQEYKSVDGTLKIHSVKQGVRPNTILVRNISCVCGVCYGGEPGVCEFASYVEPWREVTLQPTNEPAVEELRSRMACFTSSRAAIVTSGQVFCIFADSGEKQDFHLVKACSGVHQLEKDCKDCFGRKFYKRSVVIAGSFYDEVDFENCVYELDEERVTYFSPEQVFMGNVQLTPLGVKIGESPRYKLEEDDEERILNGIRF
jgi:hypothetical protein